MVNWIHHKIYRGLFILTVGSYNNRGVTCTYKTMKSFTFYANFLCSHVIINYQTIHMQISEAMQTGRVRAGDNSAVGRNLFGFAKT